MKYRDLNHDEIIAVTTLNCCANAIAANLPKLERRLKNGGNGRSIGLTKGAAKAVGNVVGTVLQEAPDEDQRQMIINRMSRLQLQFGVVRKHPENLIIMEVDDARTLLAPVLEKCDLECPCISYDENGNQVGNVAMVKACETRKALKRIGLKEVGLSIECPYQMLLGRERKG